MAVSPNGGTVFVTGGGTRDRGGLGDDYITVACNAATGARRWVSRYNGPGPAAPPGTGHRPGAATSRDRHGPPRHHSACRASANTTIANSAGAQDLTTYLDGGTLIELWPELYLPRGVRQAWEELHPILRAAAIPA